MISDSRNMYGLPPISPVLSTLVEHGERLPLQPLTQEERCLLDLWNATDREYPLECCLSQLIEEQAVALEGKTALVMDGQVVTYGDLNARANQLAHILCASGVRPGSLVGVCIERSPLLVVALLAVLKAGGAYVPMDPAYPQERLTYMLSDCRAEIVLTQQHVQERLERLEVQIFVLDTPVAMLEHQSADNLAPVATADDLAYVIYTSGSTGTPKGVQITHRSLLNLIYWHREAFAVSPEDRATQVASPAFDAAGWELWPYLTGGATVYFPDEATRVTPSLLRDWMLEHAITVSFLPTLLAEHLLQLDWPDSTPLRYLLTGADTLRHYPSLTLPFTLVNNYGPTEATVVTTSGFIAPTSGVPQDIPSIGTPIANMQVYILDEHLRRVPIGEVGELYIGGIGLASGYLHRPDLTAQRFIPHPFSGKATDRLYKTGDLARFLPDGQLAFLGRTDHQVKIRGYRVELDEIMLALQAYPFVQSCITTAREDMSGEKYLVAYIVPIAHASLTVAALREHLAQRLPEYMIPSTFVVLEQFPLTANGKLDRAALPAPDEVNTLREQSSIQPTTPVEIQVSEIVCSLLHLQEVSIDDNFFMLGGHSLLGTQIIAHISRTFGVDLSLRALFEAPTIRDLAATIEEQILVQLQTLDEEDIVRMLKGQQ